MRKAIQERLKQSRADREIDLINGTVLRYQANEQAKKLSLVAVRRQLADITKASSHDSSILLTPDILCSFLSVYDTRFIISSDPILRNVATSMINEIHAGIQQMRCVSVDGRRLGLKISTIESCTPLSDGDVKCRYEQDLLHEFLIALTFTNGLRQQIPNYQLCYAGIKTDSPEKKNRVEDEAIGCVNVCRHDTQQYVDYLLLEDFGEGSMTMLSALKTCSVEEFISWFLQLILALETGVIQFGFTHNILHPGNIIITRESETRKIKYLHANRGYIVKADSIAVMTNFELAHVKHKHLGSHSPLSETAIDENDSLIKNMSEHFGPIGYDNLGIYHNETRPFYDIYKLLMFSLHQLKKHNNAVYLKARKLSKIFGLTYEKDLANRLQTEYDLGFILNIEITDTERSMSIHDLLLLMVKEYPNLHQIFYEINNVNPVADFLSIKDCLDRVHGLQKRAIEMVKLHDPSAQATQREYDEFFVLVQQVKEDLWQKELTIYQSQIQQITTNISWYNANPSKEQYGLLEGSMISILGQYAILSAFDEKFGLSSTLVRPTFPAMDLHDH